MNSPFLKITGLTKSYGGVHALSGVDLDINAGTIHALMGENGAGKSTFIKCLAGVVQPDRGEIQIDGSPIALGDIRASEAAGIVAMHQESTAFAHLDAVDNIFVGRELKRALGLLDRAAMERETRALLDRLGEKIDIRRPLQELSLAQRQMVGMARALSHKSRLLIMDEPTASLSARETEALFRVMRQLQSEGVAILYISHRLEEVFALADRVTVLRDGRHVQTCDIGDVDREGLIRMMVGRDMLVEERAGGPDKSPVVLDVDRLTQSGTFRNISFQVHAGEIVGLAGLVGAGRSELAAAIFGIDTAESGSVSVDGKPLPPGSVQTAIERGVALVPEDRQHQGLVLPLPVSSNLLLSVLGSPKLGPLRSSRKEGGIVEDLIRELTVKTANATVPANTLSGGNQQKLAIGKWLAMNPRILILDEPTRGVDVGAKAEVYRVIRRLAAEGMATLIISSDLPEILALSDRILVMRQGEIAGELSHAEATEEKILALALPLEVAA